MEATQSNISPKQYVWYQLSFGTAYRTTFYAGPPNSRNEIPWTAANEFVYRTILRKTCILPASGIAPLYLTADQLFVTSIRQKQNDNRIILLVDTRDIDAKKVMLLYTENKSKKTSHDSLAISKEPSLNLQDALTLLRDYIIRNKIDTTNEYLDNVRLVQNSNFTEKKYWIITWAEKGKVIEGGELFFKVGMDKQIIQIFHP